MSGKKSRLGRSSGCVAEGLSLLAAVLLLLGGLAYAETFTFSGDSMETILTKGRERTLLTGNARVRTEENDISADFMELYGNNFQYIRCRGNVRVVNEKKSIELSSQELFYNRQDKVVRINGYVVMVDRKNEMVVKGGFLEKWEKTDETVIQIGVRILKKDLVCRSEFARYLRNDKLLELSGMPVVNRKGDEYRALKIFVDLDKDTIRLEGEIRGKVSSETEAEDEEGKAEQAPAQTGEDKPAQ